MFKINNIPDFGIYEGVNYDEIQFIVNKSNILVIIDENLVATASELLNFFYTSTTGVQIITIKEYEPYGSSISSLKNEVKIKPIDYIVSIGGGSTIDTAKGLSILINNSFNLPTSLKIGDNFNSSIPHISFPTTIGPGAEVSPAMIYKLDNGFKNALVDCKLIPKKVYYVQKYCKCISNYNRLCSLLDGLTHSFESLLSASPDSVSKKLSVDSINIFLKAIMSSSEFTFEIRNFYILAFQSILSNFSLRNTMTGPPHAIAYSFGFFKNIPHGALVGAALIAYITEIFNNKNEAAKNFLYNSGILHLNTIDQILKNIFIDEIKPNILPILCGQDLPSIDEYINISISKSSNHPQIKNSLLNLNSDNLESITKGALTLLTI